MTSFSATIDNIKLVGQQSNGNIEAGWYSYSGSGWPLSVSDTANGSLINAATETSPLGLSLGIYYLYADQWGLNSNPLSNTPELIVNLSDGSALTTFFNISGTPGVGNVWSIASGSTELSLGWTQGTADKVANCVSCLTPNSSNDLYLGVCLTYN